MGLVGKNANYSKTVSWVSGIILHTDTGMQHFWDTIKYLTWTATNQNGQQCHLSCTLGVRICHLDSRQANRLPSKRSPLRWSLRERKTSKFLMPCSNYFQSLWHSSSDRLILPTLPLRPQWWIYPGLSTTQSQAPTCTYWHLAEMPRLHELNVPAEVDTA